MTPQQFIDALAPAARASAARTKIPASFTIATAALESGWGSSLLAREAMNLFGIKADPSWGGAFISLPTKEFLNGQWITTEAKWRTYASWLASITDHAQFLQHDRYKDAFKTSDPIEFATAVRKAGYSTDPDYVSKIEKIIDAHDLRSLDGPAPELQKEEVMPSPSAPSNSSVNTMIAGAGGTSLVGFLTWIFDGRHAPVPAYVTAFVAACIAWVAHALYNTAKSKGWISADTPLPPAS